MIIEGHQRYENSRQEKHLKNIFITAGDRILDGLASASYIYSSLNSGVFITVPYSYSHKYGRLESFLGERVWWIGQ